MISQVGSQPSRNSDQHQQRQLDVGLDVAPQVERHVAPVAAGEQRDEHRDQRPRTGSSGIASAARFRRAVRRRPDRRSSRRKVASSQPRRISALRRASPPVTAAAGGEREILQNAHKIGLGAFVLADGRVAARDAAARRRPAQRRRDRRRRICKLAALSTAARRDVDYRLLDARLKQLMTKPAMVGLAVGVVENGRITFLQGYGETLAGLGRSGHSGNGVPLGVGVEGRRRDDGRQARRAGQDRPRRAGRRTMRRTSSCPRGNEYRATVGDLLSHRLGLYRNAYDNKLEEGPGPELPARQPRASSTRPARRAPAGPTRTSPMTRRARWSVAVTGLPYEQAVKRYPVQPDRDDQRQRLDGRARSRARSWARPHSAGRRPLPMVDTYYKVPGAGGINSNIKDMALWMLAQMGEMPDVLDGRVLDTIHAPYVVKTPTERGRLRKFLERLGTAWYGYRLAQLRLCRAPHRRPPRRHQRLSLADPVRSRRRRAASSRCGTATPASPAGSSSKSWT